MTTERHAIVTGGAKNIGLGIAKRLCDDGWRAHVLDLVEPDDPRLTCDAQRVDLYDLDATAAAVKTIIDLGPVTCLVNNVGIVCPAPIDTLRIKDFDTVLHLNLRCAIAVTQAVLPGMRAAGTGRIIMNTSRATKGKLDRSLYSASKGALQSVARSWALELAGEGITVNCVAPGPIATTAFWANNPPQAQKTRDIIEKVPVGRMGTPEDVANAVSFFADPRSGFVTGQTLYVCGGVSVG